MRSPFVSFVSVMIALAAGCASETKTTRPARISVADAPWSAGMSAAPTTRSTDGAVAPITNTDPCAMKLHDLGGALLSYYATHHALPAKLEDFRKIAGFEDAAADLTCPVSHKPYIYNPLGLPAPDGKSLMVLYDAAPSHAGMRWAVTILPSAPDQPLIVNVVAVNDGHFPRTPPK